MQQAETDAKDVTVRIVNYSDGVNNLIIETEDGSEPVEITSTQAEILSALLDVERPLTESKSVRQWN
jgi:hypothetical protein